MFGLPDGGAGLFIDALLVGAGFAAFSGSSL